MRKWLVGVLCLLGAACVVVYGLSGPVGTASIFNNISYNLDSYVDIPDLHLSVHIPPDVKASQPFTVTATISAPHPLLSLAGSGQILGSYSPNQTGRLDDLLRPPASYTGSYALCLIVQLQLDDPSAFDFDDKQEFTLVPNVTTTQTAHWTVTPRDTTGVGTVSHEATVGVWFDAETTCRVGNPSLLAEAIHLTNSTQNVEPPVTFTVVNDDLEQVRAITARLQPIAVAAVAAGTAASLGWAAGFFEWVLRRRRARREPGASEKVTHRRAARRIWFFEDILTFIGLGGALLSIGVWLITFGPSTLAYHLGTDLTLGSFFGGIVVAFVGIRFLARGVRRIRTAYSA